MNRIINKGDLLKGNYYILDGENKGKCTLNCTTQKYIKLYDESIYDKFFELANDIILDFIDSIDVMETITEEKLNKQSLSDINKYNLFLSSGKNICELFSYNYRNISIYMNAMENININKHTLKANLLPDKYDKIYMLNINFDTNEINAFKKIIR